MRGMTNAGSAKKSVGSDNTTHRGEGLKGPATHSSNKMRNSSNLSMKYNEKFQYHKKNLNSTRGEVGNTIRAVWQVSKRTSQLSSSFSHVCDRTSLSKSSSYVTTRIPAPPSAPPQVPSPAPNRLCSARLVKGSTSASPQRKPGLCNKSRNSKVVNNNDVVAQNGHTIAKGLNGNYPAAMSSKSKQNVACAETPLRQKCKITTAPRSQIVQTPPITFKAQGCTFSSENLEIKITDTYAGTWLTPDVEQRLKRASIACKELDAALNDCIDCDWLSRPLDEDFLLP